MDMGWKNAITNPPEKNGTYYAVVTSIGCGKIFDECEVCIVTYDAGYKEWDGKEGYMEDNELVLLWREFPEPPEAPSFESIINGMKK